jgi:hypothetical protein
LSMLGTGGARRSFGNTSSSGLRVRSSICAFIHFKSAENIWLAARPG